MENITLENFKVPNTCGECGFIGEYKSGPYVRHSHCCCKLIWHLKDEDYKVDENSLDKNCLLKFLNNKIPSEVYVIYKHTFDVMENHNPWNRCSIGYIIGEENADKWIASRESEKYLGWDGKKYPYYTKEKLNMLSI